MPTRDQVYEAINTERAYQKVKWGDRHHEVAAFVLFMEFYLLGSRLLESTREDGNIGGPGECSLDFVRKVTALGVACMEQHGAPRRVTSG